MRAQLPRRVAAIAVVVCLCRIGCTWPQEDAGSANPTFGTRPIDKLPKSTWTIARQQRSWDDPATGHEFHLAVYPKGAYRCGARSLERLCVIEAWCPDGQEAGAALVWQAPEAGELWRETADWLWHNQRMRARWLPVWRGPGRMTLVRGNETLAACDVDLSGGVDAWFEVRAEHPVDPVAAGWALVPKWITLVERGDLQVRLATALPRPAVLTVSARFAPAAADDASILPRGWHDLRVYAARADFTVAADEGLLSLTARDRQHPIASITQTIVPARTEPRTRFGARRTSLGYLAPVSLGGGRWADWDNVWRGGKQTDVVVGFPGRPFHLVFWRGCSYVPCWAFGDHWLTHEWLEAEPDFYGAVGCVEPLMDKDCIHSDVDILASTPARALVQWSYKLLDFEQKWIRGEHAVETFTIYPDGIGTRRLQAYIQTGWHENHEFIGVLPAGARPWECFDPQAMTFLSTAGHREDATWPLPRMDIDGYPDLIARVNMSSGHGVFQVSNDTYPLVKVWAKPYVDDLGPDGHLKPDLFNWYPHWPVTRGMRTSWLDDPARYARHPTHCNLVNIVNTAYENHDDHTEWLWLIGIAPDDDALLRAVAANWLRPGELTIVSGNAESAGYSQRDRAYRLRATRRTRQAVVRMEPPDGHPLVNPALVVEGWRGHATIRTTPQAQSICLGREDRGLVVWIAGLFPEGIEVRLAQ